MRKIVLGLLVIPFLLAFYFFYLKDYRYNKLVKEGNKIALEISKYEKEKGMLPNSLSDLGIDLIDESDPELYYTKVNNDNFMLSFSISIDETFYYYSDSKEWEYGYREINEDLP